MAGAKYHALPYAPDTPGPSLGGLPLELLRLENVITLGVCHALVALAHGCMFLAAGGGVPFGLVGVVFLVVLAAHYVNTLDDFGPGDRPVVPAVLREGDLGDDVFVPLRRLALAALLTLGPGTLLHASLPHPAHVAVLPLFAVGLVALPAVLLTLVDGSSPLNLTPRRLVALIVACGRDYAVVVVLMAVSLGLHIAAGVAVAESIASVYGRSVVTQAPVPSGLAFGVSQGVVAVAVYAGHFAAAATGRLHALHARRFGWHMQVHVRRATT